MLIISIECTPIKRAMRTLGGAGSGALSDRSYRTILRSSSIVGAAQVVNTLVSVFKLKVVAVLIGPAGVGLVGLYMNLVQTASTVAALGFGNVGTRQIAMAQTDGGEIAVGRTRRALFWGTFLLAGLGSAAFWALSDWIARLVLDDPSRKSDVALLSIAVGMSVISGSQAALLTGLRRVGDLARVNVLSSVLSGAFGIAALWIWGDRGLLALVLLAPVATCIVGRLYVSRLGPPAGHPARLRDLAQEWRDMARIGSTFMLSGLVTVLGLLLARTLIQRELGANALGQFQGAWVIGMTYLGFVLTAMGTDYYPLLAGVIKDRAAAARLVNEQTEVALFLCAPVLVCLLGFAPYVIQLLYSAEFAPAVEILRWQLLGDLLKLMSWPLGFVLLASGAGKTFVMTESLATGVFLVVIWIGLPILGVAATGVAFLILYAVYLPLVWWFAKRSIAFKWSRAVKAQLLVSTAATLAVFAAAQESVLGGAILSCILGGALGLWALISLSSRTDANGVLGRMAAIGDRVKGWSNWGQGN